MLSIYIYSLTAPETENPIFCKAGLKTSWITQVWLKVVYNKWKLFLLLLSSPVVFSHPSALYDPSVIFNILWDVNMIIAWFVECFVFCICLVHLGSQNFLFFFSPRSGKKMIVLELLHDSFLWSIVWTIIFNRQILFN